MNKKIKIFLLIFILIILIGLIFIIINKTMNNYNKFKIHKDYFKQDTPNQKIESWMNIRLIENKFNLTINNELNLSLNFYQKAQSLDDICIENKMDCKKIVKELNKKIK